MTEKKVSIHSRRNRCGYWLFCIGEMASPFPAYSKYFSVAESDELFTLRGEMKGRAIYFLSCAELAPVVFAWVHLISLSKGEMPFLFACAKRNGAFFF